MKLALMTGGNTEVVVSTSGNPTTTLIKSLHLSHHVL